MIIPFVPFIRARELVETAVLADFLELETYDYHNEESSDIEIVQGEDKSILFVLTNEGTPLDMTAMTEATVLLKQKTTVLQKTYTSGDINFVGDPTLGKLKCDIFDDETLELAPNKHDCELILDFGDTRRILQLKGKVTIKKRLINP